MLDLDEAAAKPMISLTQSLADIYAPIQDELLETQGIFDEELVSDLTFINEFCRGVRSYRGKMLRPALLLLSAQATGQLLPVHRRIAAVVEMVHVATLVHDDVLDEADERRSRPTIRAAGGNVAAVLLGDYLISHAFHLCSGLDSSYASRRIGATTNSVCEGELLQTHRRGHLQLGEAEYLEIISKKTGALTAVACELGAHFADAPRSQTEALGAYGLSAGTAFQIVDDVLDLVGEEEEMGKTLGLDVRLGNPTLPIIHCLAHATPATRSVLQAALSGERSCNRKSVCDWLEQTDSVQYALSVATGFVAEAVRQLDLLPPSDAKASLTAMAEFILERRF